MTQYDHELALLRGTYVKALSLDVSELKKAIAAASGSSVIGVGSGGSFTVASLLCKLHEAYTGRVSRSSTPLEIVCNPTLAATSPVFLVSAEGKNPDITAALSRARYHSSRAVHVLTNRTDSLLTKLAGHVSDVRSHIYPVDYKDGFLATNTLLLNAILVARAYAELDRSNADFPATLDEMQIDARPLQDWLAHARDFVSVAARRGALFVTFSPLLHPIAADLESKLAEAALLHCQLADLRSFAHGRHLWPTKRTNDCAIVAIVDRDLGTLWEHTRSLLPAETVSLTMQLSGAKPADLITGLIAEMHLIGLIGNALGVDPGRPDVPQSGRDIYYMPVDDLVPKPTETPDWGETSKAEVLGALWPRRPRVGTITRASEEYRLKLQGQIFRAVVFDYDGTLCASQSRDRPPPDVIVAQLSRLLSAGVIVGIVSGRGDSLQDQLRQALPSESWDRVLLALYNGGWIADVATKMPDARGTNEFLSHVIRIVRRLQTLGAPIETIRPTHPYQVSVRFAEGIDTQSMWFVIADSLREAGLNVFTTVRSKHSVDVLAPDVNKSALVGMIVNTFHIEPYRILTMGDQGAWPGNDAGLLEHRFSLSVDAPSRRMDRGWKFAPAQMRDVAAALWYLKRFEVLEHGTFRVSLGDSIAQDTGTTA
jgi:HAD superfamily hydrolase (TIGR01484 family)